MQRENVKHITAAAVVDTVLQFCWEFKENPCLFGQNARQEWSPTWQSTDLSHCLFLILEGTKIGVILFKKQNKWE